MKKSNRTGDFVCICTQTLTLLIDLKDSIVTAYRVLTLLNESILTLDPKDLNPNHHSPPFLTPSIHSLL